MTLRDVARKARVHPATVSRALRNDPCISAGVRDSVQRIAKRLRYRVNPLVAALMRNRRRRKHQRFQGALACVTAYGPQHGAEMRRLLARFSSGMLPRAAELGYTVDCFNVWPGEMSALRLKSVLRTRKITGVILGPAHSVQEAVDLDLSAFSAVALGLSYRKSSVNWVSHDHFSAMRMTLHRCREDYGFRRIGLVLPRRVSEKVDQRWLAAYLLDQSDGHGAQPPLVFQEEIEQPSRFLEWMAKHRPDVVIGVKSGRLAEWLRVAGWRVPEQVGCVSLDCADESAAVTGVIQDYGRIGATAIELLVGMVERHEAGSGQSPLHVLIDGQWRPGSSTVERLLTASPM